MKKFALDYAKVAHEDHGGTGANDIRGLKEKNIMNLEMILTGCIINNLHFSYRLAQRIPTGIMRPCI